MAAQRIAISSIPIGLYITQFIFKSISIPQLPLPNKVRGPKLPRYKVKVACFNLGLFKEEMALVNSFIESVMSLF